MEWNGSGVICEHMKARKQKPFFLANQKACLCTAAHSWTFRVRLMTSKSYKILVQV